MCVTEPLVEQNLGEGNQIYTYIDVYMYTVYWLFCSAVIPNICKHFHTALYTLHPLASRKGLEDQVKKLKSEKTAVNSELRQLEERYGNLEHELGKIQEENHTLMEAKADLEVGYGYC